jgi:hypothetical protein
LTPASPDDTAATIAFALQFQARKRIHNADELMTEFVAKRLVEHLSGRLCRDEEAANRGGRAGPRSRGPMIKPRLPPAEIGLRIWRQPPHRRNAVKPTSNSSESLL